MNQNQSDKKVERAIENSAGKIDKNAIKQAAKTNDPAAIINSLSGEDRKKLNELLKNRDAVADILKSPKAASLMKSIMGKNGNG